MGNQGQIRIPEAVIDEIGRRDDRLSAWLSTRRNIFLIPKIYPFLQRMMGLFLIWIAILLIYNEKESKIKAIMIFILAGFLGLASLNLDIKQPLLPLLTGLFGTSTIIHSIKSKTIVPKQKIKKQSFLKE